MLVDIEKRIITDTEIFISGNTTVHFQYNKIRYIDIKDTLYNYKELINLAVLNNIKVSKKAGLKAKLKELQAAYITEYTEHTRLFNLLSNGCKSIFTDTFDTDLYNTDMYNELVSIYYKLQKQLYRSSVLSIITDIDNRINELTTAIMNQNIEYGSYYTQITL